MDSLAEASKIFCKSVVEYQKAYTPANERRKHFIFSQITYKSILDSNFLTKFCIDGHCKTIFMVEVKYDGSNWGATPKIFDSKEEAKREAKYLMTKYSFVSECRIVTRRMEEK